MPEALLLVVVSLACWGLSIVVQRGFYSIRQEIRAVRVQREIRALRGGR